MELPGIKTVEDRRAAMGFAMVLLWECPRFLGGALRAMCMGGFALMSAHDS